MPPAGTDVAETNETARRRLAELLVERSYRYTEEATFLLTSGKTSSYYVDCKKTTMCGDAMPLVGRLVAAHTADTTVAIGGLTMGADWLASSAAYWRSAEGRPLDAFSIRKEAKKHGTRKWLEGRVEAGARVAIVDDVCTTGGSTITGIERSREGGLVVGEVIVLVDREEDDGMARIRAAAGPGVPVTAVFTRTDLHAVYLRTR